MAEAHAVREFGVADGPWPVVEEWAARQGYREVERAEDHRRYRKGSGFWVGSRMAEIRWTGDAVHLEAWVYANPVARAMALFIVPREITIESGGPRAMLPRKLGRTEVNDLLRAFGQSPIG